MHFWRLVCLVNTILCGDHVANPTFTANSLNCICTCLSCKESELQTFCLHNTCIECVFLLYLTCNCDFFAGNHWVNPTLPTNNLHCICTFLFLQKIWIANSLFAKHLHWMRFFFNFIWLVIATFLQETTLSTQLYQPAIWIAFARFFFAKTLNCKPFLCHTFALNCFFCINSDLQMRCFQQNLQ